MRSTRLAAVTLACAASIPMQPALAQPGVRNPEFLEQFAATRRFSLGEPGSISVRDPFIFFLRSDSSRSFIQDLWVFDSRTGQERVLLRASDLLQGQAENLSPEEKARRERLRMAARGITGYQITEAGNRLLVPLSDRLFVVDLDQDAAPTIRELKSSAGYPLNAQLSRGGSLVGVTRRGNLFVINVQSGEERQLTTLANEHLSFGIAEFVAQEEMHRREGFWFSPDNATILYQRTETSGVEMFSISDPANPGKPPQSWPYPRAGKTNAEVTLGLIPANGGDTTWVSWDRQRFPYVARVAWQRTPPGADPKPAESGVLTVVVQNREQTEQLLLRVDEKSGQTSTILRETDPAWINLYGAQWIDDCPGFLWTTEQDATPPNDRPRLELRNPDGSLNATLLDGSQNFHVVSFESPSSVLVSINDEFRSNQIWRVNPADPHKRAALTPTQPFFFHSPVRGHATDLWVDIQSHPDGSVAWEVRRESAAAPLGVLKSVAEPPPFVPKPIFTTVIVDGRELNTSIVRPRDFDPSKKYPVIESVYGGPGGAVVSGSPRAYLMQQWLADQGFIVAALDARGTPGKGRAWERATKNNVIDIPLAEHAAGMLALCAKFKEMDASRIGIQGWSFGGYFSAIAPMRRPDVYKAGCAGAPVVDWRDYDSHYTERYMGLPDQNAQGYHDASVLTYCKDLSVPLLIIHGTADDNVYMINSLRMTDALFRAGKPFEFVPLSGFTHSVSEPAVVVQLWTRIATFFKAHLGDPA